ncbi:MAG: fatty acid desaturase [Bdellovibrionota bacterium]
MAIRTGQTVDDRVCALGVYPNADELKGRHWKSFASEIDALGAEMRSMIGQEDFAHFKKLELWGRLATVLGYATAWILPNPISAFLISQGNYARWSLALHTVSHGAFDRLPQVPERYKSSGFAKGWRRLVDWLDWIEPTHWDDEHNHLHHFHLGSPKDPDVVSRNTEYIQSVKSPILRYFLFFVMATIWKPAYYAVNTLAESRYQKGLLPTNRIGWNNWNPMTPEGRELWSKCFAPYFLFRFVLLPALFLPLGTTAALFVLINSILAEAMTNLHSFAMIAPSHTGDDVYMFGDSAKGKADYYLRQIVGTVNYPAGSDIADFFYGGMNYQIEHHLWPEASLLQCQRVRPRLKEVCRRYGVHYAEESLFKRLVSTFSIVTGRGQQAVKFSREKSA